MFSLSSYQFKRINTCTLNCFEFKWNMEGFFFIHYLFIIYNLLFFPPAFGCNGSISISDLCSSPSFDKVSMKQKVKAINSWGELKKFLWKKNISVLHKSIIEINFKHCSEMFWHLLWFHSLSYFTVWLDLRSFARTTDLISRSTTANSKNTQQKHRLRMLFSLLDIKNKNKISHIISM